MTMDTVQMVVLDDRNVCSAEHLVDVSGLTPEELALLIDSGVIVPTDAVREPQVFHLHYVVVATTARRLRDDFELDGAGLALALTLLRRVNDAEAELALAKAQLARMLAL